MNQGSLIKIFEGKHVSFFPIYLMDMAATSSVRKLLGKSCDQVVCFYDKTNMIMYANEKSWKNISDIAQSKLINDNNFYRKIKKGMIERCQGLEKFSDSLLKIDPKKLSNKQLVSYYDKFEKITIDLRAYAWIPNLVDMGSVSIFDIAEKKIKERIGEEPRIKEYMSVLTTPEEKTKQREHELELYKIQSVIQNKRIKNWKKTSK